MIVAVEIISLTTSERFARIREEVANCKEVEDDLQKASEIVSILNTFVGDYIDLQIERDRSSPRGSILLRERLEPAIAREMDLFKPIAVSALRAAVRTPEELRRSSKNIYEISGARWLALANKVTRTISGTMGSLWERVANISPYAINPELEFGIKVVGIDLIAKNIETREIEYQQLKTQKNTLTGSQKPRSLKELRIHEHPVFCVSIDNKSGWTFRDVSIPRVAGAEFWSRIGIPYEIVLENASSLILELEQEFVHLLNPSDEQPALYDEV